MGPKLNRDLNLSKNVDVRASDGHGKDAEPPMILAKDIELSGGDLKRFSIQGSPKDEAVNINHYMNNS